MYRPVGIACACLVIAGLLNACGSSKEARRERRDARQEAAKPEDGTKPKQRANLFPTVLRSEPSKPYLDLGPVVVSSQDRTGLEAESVLQDVGRRIGADAFILEQRKITEAYPIQRVAMRRYMSAYSGDVFEVTTYVFRGSPTGDARGPVLEKGFYRAIRFVEGEPGPCNLDGKALEEEASLLEDASTLREQLRRLSVLLTRGLIDVETFRRVRKACLDQLPLGP